MKKIGCFLVFLWALASVPLYADNDITLFGAAQRQGTLNVQSGTTAATKLSTFDPGTFGLFGARFGHGKIVGGEHTIAYAPNFVEASTKAIFYNSNFLVQAPLPKIKPYGTVGLGSIFTWGTDSSDRPSFAKLGNKFALNYGGGIKVLPAGPVGIRLDIRGYLIPDAKFNVPAPTAADPLATVKSQGQTLKMFEAGFGIIFAFGGRK